MLRIAGRAKALLHEAGGRVARFLQSQVHGDGGFRGLAGTSDLYYTVFGIEGLSALGVDVPVDAIARYLRTFGAGEGLDFVHLACLAQCWANLPAPLLTDDTREAILRRIEVSRTRDGGYAHTAGPTADDGPARRGQAGCVRRSPPDGAGGTVYGCFLALAVWEDLRGGLMPDVDGVVGCIESLKAAEGGYTNAPGLPCGSTPATAAAVTVLRRLGRVIPRGVADWLLARHHPPGGFVAMPFAPIPDLLSTATGLHALAGMNIPLGSVREGCLGFIESVRCDEGGFRGTWAEEPPDCEYTYYALLALGHLHR